MRYLLFFPLLVLMLTGCATSSVSTTLDDQQNESLATRLIRNAHPDLEAAKVNVTSYNGVVLITGQVSSAELIPLATAAVEPLRNVRRVHNELVVAGQTTLIAKTNDSWITTKVKSALLTDETAQATNIKVVTEAGVVYLMGRVTRAEADAAVGVARDIQGVQKIVTVFDYINQATSPP